MWEALEGSRIGELAWVCSYKLAMLEERDGRVDTGGRCVFGANRTESLTGCYLEEVTADWSFGDS